MLKYRSDIDGLRAVAVLGVVIYHAFPWVIPGGFIGVDIFFVISGYLISGILFKGHSAGNFSFKEFYARRIRRLFPALITVLAITMAYGWLVLLPDEFEQLGKHVAAGTLFIQNIVFWQESGYFDTAANLKPLLHLWSLAVEEQFYIFFPPILLLIWKRKWPIMAIMGVLLVVSMAGNLWMSVHASSADFFLTPYRAWEFLGGSLLAWWHYDKGHQHSEEKDFSLYREALSWAGVLLLVLGMAFIHAGDSYPGWRAVLPVAGTLLLMEGGLSAWVNRKVLSNPAVVWIGLISYPLYLFHWPALSFVHIVKGESPKPVYLADALIIALILSAITYYLIEKKIRHHKSRYTILALVASFLLMGGLGWGAFQKIVPSRPISLAVQKMSRAVHDKDIMAGLIWLPPGNYDVCYNKAGGSGPQTLFLGDSNMQQYGTRIGKLLANNTGESRGAILVTTGGVIPIKGVTDQQGKSSADLISKFQEVIFSDSRIDRVVISARWVAYFSTGGRYRFNGVSLGEKGAQQNALQELGGNIRTLVANGKKVILILSIPTGAELDPKKMYPRNFKGIYREGKKVLLKEAFLREYGEVLNAIAKTARENGAEVIDPLDYLCADGICIAEDENGPIRYDEGHLRPGYVREHLKYLDSTVAP